MNNVCVCVFSLFRYVTFLFNVNVCFLLFLYFLSSYARVCLYNFAFSHLFYNWGAAARTKQYKEKIIFIVKTIHCMWVCVCLFVCVSVCVALQNKRDLCFVCLLRYCNFWLYILPLLFLFLDVKREIVNYRKRARFIAIFLLDNVFILSP